MILCFIADLTIVVYGRANGIKTVQLVLHIEDYQLLICLNWDTSL